MSGSAWRRAFKEKSQHWNMRVWKCEKLFYKVLLLSLSFREKKKPHIFLTQSFFLSSVLLPSTALCLCWNHWHQPWTIRAPWPRKSNKETVKESESVKVVLSKYSSNQILNQSPESNNETRRKYQWFWWSWGWRIYSRHIYEWTREKIKCTPRWEGNVLPYKRLMGMCLWMGSHF